MQLTKNRHCTAYARDYSLASLLALWLNLLILSGPAHGIQPEQEKISDLSAVNNFAAHSLMLDVAQVENRLIAVGERGIIITSEDDGRSWNQASSPVTDTLTRVQFVDSDHGWVVGHGGVVLNTNDGGDTWHQQLDGENAAQIELDAALEAQRENDGDSEERRVSSARRLVSEGADKPFLTVHFFDQNSGIVLGAYGLAFATEDGGETWQSITHRLDNPRELHLYDFEIVNGNYFIAGEQGLLMRSDGRGKSFRMLDTPTNGTFFGMLSASSSNLLVFGLKGRIFLSEDRGETWNLVPNDDDVTITSGKKLPDGTLLLVDEAGRLMISNDGGRHFDASPVPNPTYLTGLTSTNDGAVVLTSVRGVFRLPSDHQVVEN